MAETNDILVFIKSRFVKKTEAYTLDELPSNKLGFSDNKVIHMDDLGWQTVKGPILVGCYYNTTMEQAKELMKQHCPKADPDIFTYIPAKIEPDTVADLCSTHP